MKLLFLFVLWIINTTTNGYRLHTDVLPEHYDLEILTNFGIPSNFSFSGHVVIRTNCIRPTKNITLHSKGLIIDEKRLTVKDETDDGTKSKEIDIDQIELDEKNEFLIIHLKYPLHEDQKYRVSIHFMGQLEDSLSGFYRSSYTDSKTNEKKWLGVTQFEACSARKAFPCFDEPAMKATFNISLGRKEGFSSISNMPLLFTEPISDKEGWFWDRYENSVPMSTYLVAFIVSDFGYEVAEPSLSHNVTFRIWARKDALDQVGLAKHVGPMALAYFETYFNITYPLPKQDMVAVPDFSAGAMENWGLITYREALLLFDPDKSSSTSQHRVAEVISHELAHQWFGNLVTMKWWTDLWLNEGFATYMAGLAVHHLFPEWNSLEEEAADNLLNVFSFDSLKSSHPVSAPIGHPDMINEIFDTISYKKGSFLIRMMGLFLGEGTLRRGVSNYLREHKFGNAEQDDLWQALTAEAHSVGALPENLTVKSIMDTWTVQTGYPVVTVTRNYENNTAEVKQERFLRDVIKAKEVESCWWVPLSYTSQNELEFNSTQPKDWLSCSSDRKILNNLPGEDEWIIFNIQAAGLYKVNYDEKNWHLIIDTLNSENYDLIPVLNRVQVIDDVSDLCWTGKLKYDFFFKLFHYLKYEEKYLPWKAALNNINTVNKQLKQNSNYGKFKAYMRSILAPIYEKVGGLTFSKTKIGKLDLIKHQVLITSWACRFEVAGCISDSQRLMKQWRANLKSTNPIPKDLRSIVYCTAIKYGGEDEWNFIWEQYKRSNVPTEKSSMLSNLGCSREEWLLSRYLQWTLDDKSDIRSQDRSTVFTAVAANDLGFYIAKDFLFNNIDKLFESYKDNARRMSRYLSSIAGKMTTPLQLTEFESFIQKNQKYLNKIKQGVEQSLENVKLNIQWQTMHLPKLETVLHTTLKSMKEI